ncbi:predicted protein [Coccidioides posadasii str. Silveira]|uniref:Predicted protein n=2 Tax=Coccidioides posadasii TaxID=199306 RepID=E9DDG9_COCPS|nr:predicted protein [Coccidioides posadasii str. Silveira]KMM65615.1 hypothetical protein CPAG_01961 [Coccidioides posadasii RMSCC 3488]
MIDDTSGSEPVSSFHIETLSLHCHDASSPLLSHWPSYGSVSRETRVIISPASDPNHGTKWKGETGKTIWLEPYHHTRHSAKNGRNKARIDFKVFSFIIPYRGNSTYEWDMAQK